MPFQSDAQRKFLYSQKPNIAKQFSKEDKKKAKVAAIKKRMKTKNDRN